MKEHFLEELYHSLTLCTTGKKGFKNALNDLNQKIAAAGLTGQSQVCAACLGEEILAKDCAKRTAGKPPFSNTSTAIGAAESSCSEHCAGVLPENYVEIPNSPVYGPIDQWMQALEGACDEITKSCGS